MTDVIRNLTPHPVNVYLTESDEAGTAEIVTIPPEAPPARIVMTDVGIPSYVDDVPIGQVHFGEPLNLPQPESGVWLIVSLPLALAVFGRPDVLFPYREVRDATGRILGCRALGRVV